MLKDLELAENAATETLLKLFQAGEEQLDLENPERWLFTVAKNHCLSLLSQRKRRREIRDQLKPSLQTVSRAHGEDELQAEDLRQRIRRALNEKEWSIWDLHQQGYDNREIAEKLALSEKTAANLKSIARNKLRAAFKKDR